MKSFYNFIKEHKDYISMVIIAIIIEFALIVGVFIAADALKLLFAVAVISFPSICLIVFNAYDMAKHYWECAEKEYDLAKKMSDLIFEHMGSSCKHISESTDIIKERYQNMSDLAEIYMSKSKSDMEYHNEQIHIIMESLKIIAKALDNKNN